jgi:hypothetical protein
MLHWRTLALVPVATPGCSRAQDLAGFVRASGKYSHREKIAVRQEVQAVGHSGTISGSSRSRVAVSVSERGDRWRGLGIFRPRLYVGVFCDDRAIHSCRESGPVKRLC